MILAFIKKLKRNIKFVGDAYFNVDQNKIMRRNSKYYSTDNKNIKCRSSEAKLNN